MRKFDIQKLSKDTLLSEAEIKRRLGMRFRISSKAQTYLEAKIEFYTAPKGSVKKEIAYNRWVELFLKDVNSASNRKTALALFNDAPPNAFAKQMVLEKVAYFYGLTDFVFYETPLNTAKTMRSAISRAFKHLPPGKQFVGPQGKLKLFRNEVELGPHAEVLVKLNNEKDKRILFAAYWSKNTYGFRLRTNWGKTHKFVDWNDKW